MYAPGPHMQMVPPANFCTPQGYGNVPYPQPFNPYYPPACNYYNNQTPGDGSQPSFNPAPQMPLFSQPPPGYGVDGAQICQTSCNNNAVSSYQPVHMANVRSTSFNGYSAPSAVPVNTTFSRPPPTIKQINCGANRFNGHDNNRRMYEPKNSPYYCEVCDRGFPSMYKFTQHNSEHITCKLDGCTYTAHPKMMEKHVAFQHRSGLFNKIVRGYAPEEIKKWVTERKRHFPTKGKIEEKQSQREEMKKRGERYAERKHKLNERNNSFKSGPNNRFNRSIPNKNGRFASKTFAHRRNLTRVNVKKEPAKFGDEDCILRNILPFQGTAFHLNVKTEAENEKHILSDDCTILSDDDDISVVYNNCATTKENVISELEKTCETSKAEENNEEDCLDKYFKYCDTANDNDEKIDKCDTSDKNSANIIDSKIDDTELPKELPVNHSITQDPLVKDEPVLKSVGSLALIQCYDSDGSDDEDGDIPEPNLKLMKVESKMNDSINDGKSDEDSSKSIRIKNNNRESCSSPLRKADAEKNDSSDDSEPDEVSSKCVPIEADISQNEPPPLEKIEPEQNEIEPVPSTSKSACEESDKDCESKKRKRKRRRESKDEVEGKKEPEEEVKEKLPLVHRPRRKYKPPTLLEKLLSSEIKHERNVVLQCIRYVVGKDFFQIGKSDSS